MAFCAKCGGSVDQGMAFCASCGTPVAGAVAGPSGSPSGRIFAVDFSRLAVIDWVLFGAAFVVFIGGFLPFYSVSSSLFSVSFTATDLESFMWLTVLIGLAGAVEVFLMAALQPPLLQKKHRVIAHVVAASVTLLLLLIFLLLRSPGSGVGFSLGGILVPIASGVWLGFSIKWLIETNKAAR